MSYRARVPGDWRKMQRAAVDEETNRERERRRLNQQRWRLIRHVLKRAAFFVVLALVIIAALCGLTLGGLAAARPRRRRY